MKIAITASQNHVKSKIEQHFGRCKWYCIFDTETKTWEFIENTTRNNAVKAGSDAVDLLLNKGISIAVSGRFGSKVVEAFRTNNVQMVIPEQIKTINDIINLIK